MARYIDADFVTANINRVLEEKKTEKETTAYFAFEQFKFLLGQAPTADVVEVKHGKWEVRILIFFDSEKVGYRCSECNTTWDVAMKYCPNCGAKMDGEKALKERESE